jgi:hypothetical protein
MPCIVHLTDGTTLKASLTADQLHEAWVAGRGMPVFVDVEGETVGEWLNLQQVVRFHDERA